LAEPRGMLGERRGQRGNRLRVERHARRVLDRQTVGAEQEHGIHTGASGEALDHLSQLDHGAETPGQRERCAT
jgi:hypothetical protein